MAKLRYGVVLRYLRRTADSSVVDRELLQRFLELRDQAAFEMLVCRHGPMVLGVCRRLLDRGQDVDDCFQATFLVLVRRAGSLSWEESIGGWLHQVASRVALKLRASGRRRLANSRELDGEDLADPRSAATGEVDRVELRDILDDELQRLPAKYRHPLVLCYLQGKTHEEAAAELGWPRGSMARRLTRAQELLKARLVGRGVLLSAAWTTALVAENAEAAVPPTLLTATVQAAEALTVGGPCAGIISDRLSELVEGVIETMFPSKLKMAVVVLAVLGVLAGGVGWFWPADRAGNLGLAQANAPAAPAVADAKAALIREPLLAWSGPNSAVTKTSYRRVASKQEWETLWQEHAGKVQKDRPATVLPRIDFSQCMVVAVFQGSAFNSQGVNCVSVSETTAAITLRFVGDRYQTLNGVDEVTPFGIFLLPRSAKPLILEENVQNLLGGAPVWKVQARFELLAAVPLPEPPVAQAKAPVTAQVLAERLKQIADEAIAKDQPFRESVKDSAVLLLGKAANPVQRFDAPDLAKPEALEEFRNRIIGIQQGLALILFQLDGSLEQLSLVEEDLPNQPPDWQARFHYVNAALKARLAHLYEFNARLGQMRKEIPELDAQTQQGWQLTAGKDYLERDAAKYAANAKASLERLAKDHPNTKWAEFSKEELPLLVGLKWEPFAKQ
jgi:RNA polymerase sigma factor (sigma-70 family)